jgi:hypothetical protein
MKIKRYNDIFESQDYKSLSDFILEFEDGIEMGFINLYTYDSRHLNKGGIINDKIVLDDINNIVIDKDRSAISKYRDKKYSPTKLYKAVDYIKDMGFVRDNEYSFKFYKDKVEKGSKEFSFNDIVPSMEELKKNSNKYISGGGEELVISSYRIDSARGLEIAIYGGNMISINPNMEISCFRNASIGYISYVIYNFMERFNSDKKNILEIGSFVDKLFTNK